MRNLKRVLSLALALVMMLGMMVIGANAASADFADADEITYTEAVEVMSGLGIIEGYNGSFNPDGTLTREQAAKIICYMLMGPTTAEKLGSNTQIFDDVAADRWSAPYIAYCANLGIIAGVGDNAFDPEGELTGVAFAKMLLVALGNDPVACGYVGGNWATSVAVDAIKIGLDIEGVALADSLSREQACQMAWSALTYTTNGGTVYNVTDGTNTYTFDNLQDAVLYKALLGGSYSVVGPVTTTTGSLADKVFSLDSDTAIVTANQATTTNKYTTIGGANYAVETGLDLIGHVVTVYYKKAASAPAAGYETFAVVDNSTTFEMTATTTQAQLNAALGVSSNPASYSYTKYNGTYGTNTVTDNPVGTAGTAIIYNKAVIGFVEPTSYYLSKVTAIGTTAGSESITLDAGTNGGNAIPNNATTDEVVEYDGIAVNDYVVFYKVGSIFHLSKAQTLTGTPTKINGNKITIGGVVYDKAGTDRSGLTPVTAASMTFTGEYTLYLAPDGSYITSTAKASGNVVTDLVYLVAKFNKTEDASTDFANATATKYYAQCVDMAGNQVIYQITKAVYDDDSTYAASTLYKVSTAEGTDAGNSNMKAVYASFTSASSTATASVTLAANAVKVPSTRNYFTDSVKFIYVDGTLGTLKVTVKDGVQALDSKDIEYVAEQVGATTNYTVSYVIVKAAYEAPVVSGSGVMFAAETSTSTAKVPYTDASGNTQTGYEHTVYIDGVKTTIITSSDTAISGFKTYTVAGNLYTITGTNSAANLKAATDVTNMYNGLISTSGVNDLPVAGATVVNVSSNTKVPTDPTALTTADTVALVLNADGTAVVTIYVTASSRS